MSNNGEPHLLADNAAYYFSGKPGDYSRWASRIEEAAMGANYFD